MPGTPSVRVEPPRDGSPARFRRPLATDPDETDRDDIPGNRDPSFRSAPLWSCHARPAWLLLRGQHDG